MRRLQLSRIIILITSVIALSLTGCGGGGADVQSDVRATTTGQELTDLKRALDEGVITQEEYEQQRQEILDEE